MKRLLLVVTLLGFNFLTAVAQVPALSSNPGCAYVVYLDFDGEIVNNANWYSSTVTALAPSLTSAQITDVWKRVAEKYRPFNINITTDFSVYNAAAAAKKIRAVITPTSSWYGSAGGVAYVGCFGYTSYDPAWIFSNNLANTPEYIADAIAHEVGHTLGLQHHGQYNASCSKIADYHSGKGNGQTGWGPIMGAPYGLNIVGWYKGATTGTTCATSVQDDLLVITSNNGFGYRADDKGNNIGAAATLGIVSNAFSDSAIIEQNTDVDIFKLTLSQTSSVTINARPFSTVTASNTAATLDIKLVLYNSGGTILAIDTPTTKLNATITYSNLPSGSYYISINGMGISAYTDYGGTGAVSYGSLGRYYVTGTIVSTGASSLPPVANFTVPSGTICAGQSAAFTDNSSQSPTSWTWTCTGGTPSSSTSQNPSFNFASGGTYNVKLKATNANGSDSIIKQVTITNLPAITLTSNASICNGGSTALTVSGASAYAWSPSTGLNSTILATVTANPTATITYSVTGTASGCSSSKSVAVTVNSVPNITTSLNTTICAGGNTTITTGGASTYTWLPSSSLDNNTATSVVATPSSNTTYTVTGTGANGCTGNKTVTILVTALPVLTTSSDAVICSGGGATLAVSGATTYLWAPATGLSSTTATSITAAPSGNITYTVSGTGNGCSATKQIAVTVNSNPSVTVSSNATVCNGASSGLTAGGAVTYSWSPFASLNASTGNTVNATPAASTTYTVTGTDANGCTGGNTLLVTVNALPVLTVSPDATICEGGSTTLTVNGATTYSWLPSSSLSNTTGSSVTAAPLVTTTYIVTGSSAVGCTAVKTISITVNSVPVLIGSSNTGICAGANTTLTVSGASTYTWSPSTGLDNSTSSLVVSAPVSDITYTVTGITGGCSSSKQITVSVHANPVITASNDVAICPGGNSTLTAAGAIGYNWSPASTLDANMGDTVLATPVATTVYTVTGIDMNGCTGGKTILVIVNDVPVLTVSPDESICIGTSSYLTANGAFTYAWSPSLSLNITTGNSVIATPLFNTTYSVTGTDINGCTSSAAISVNVNLIPIVNVSNDTAICSGASVDVSAGGASSYTWLPATGLSSTTGDAVTATPAVTVTYTITGFNGGCSTFKQVKINVKQSPVLVAGSNPAVCDGQPAVLTVTGASAYSWTPSSTLDNDTSGTVIATPSVNTSYTVTGTGSNGCTSSKVIAVTINATPVTTVSADATICQGAGASLTAGGALTYSWFPGADLSDSTAVNVTASPDVTTTYTVTGYNGGCFSTAQVVVNVNNSPVMITSGDAAVCAGNSASLIVSGADSYTWLPASSLNDATNSSVTANPGVTTTYTITGMGTNGCSSSKNIAVNVTPLPVLTTSPNTAICAASNTTLTVSGADAYTWSPSTGLDNSTSSSVIASPVVTTTYTVTGATNNCSSSKTIVITVIALPVLTISPDVSICSGSTTNLTASGSTTYVWVGAGLDINSGASVVASPTITTTYVVGGTTSGCSSSQQVIVTIKAIPAIITGGNPSICNGNSANLTASGASTYTWAPSTALNNTTGNAVTASPSSNTTYTITGVGANGCTASITAVVTVGALPTLNTSIDAVICSGSNTTLNVNGASTYAWSPASSLSNSTGNSVTASPSLNTTYTVTGTTNGCSSSKQIAITVNALPVLTTSSNTSICSGSSTIVTASGADSYTWSPASSLNNSTGNSVTASPTTTSTYTVTGTTNGCSAGKSIVITVMGVPFLTTSSNATLCAGNNTTLTVSGASVYTWLPSSELNNSTSSSVIATPSFTTTFTVTGTANGCSSTKQISVTVTPLPVLTLSPDVTICSGGNTVLAVTGATTYSWSPAGGLNVTNATSVTASPTFTTTYNVTGITNSCSSSKQVAVTVNALPVITTNANTSVCNGNPANLTVSGANTYVWLPVTALNSTTGSNVIATPSSSTTYTVTGTAINGCTANKTVIVGVGALPTLATSSNASICAGAASALTVSGATAYTWAPATGLSNTTAASITANPISTITYTVTGTANGCSSSKQVTITVNPLPALTVSSGASICKGSSIGLTAGGAATYTWTPASSLNNSTSVAVTATPTITTTYTITGTGSNGCTASGTVAVMVYAVPAISTSPNTVICSGNSTTVIVSGASIYNWSPATGLNNSTGTNIVANPAITTTYTVTGSANGCSASKQVIITVNASPVLTVSSAVTLCKGESSNLVVSGASTYVWSPAGGINSSTAATVSANPTVSTTYSVTGTTNGCSSSKQIPVTVNALPVLTLSSNATICNGNSATLTGGGAATYKWSPTMGLNTTTGSGVSASPAATVTYTMTGTAANGCTATKTVAVTVNALPTLTTSPDKVICSGNNTTLTVNGATTYSWSPATGLNSTTAANVTAAPVVLITYTVTGTTNGCSSSKQVKVTVNATPVLTTSSNTAICGGSSANLTVSGATTYVWTPSTGLNSTTATNVTAVPGSTITYTVTGTTGGCPASKTITVSVTAAPLLTLTANTLICSGGSANLTAGGATTYSWSPATGLNNTTATGVTASPAITTTYTVTGTKNGCSASKIVAVTVNAVPVLTLTSNTAICKGGSTSLTVSGAASYTWAPNKGLNNATAANVTSNPTATITYTVTGTSNGCSATKQVAVTVNALPVVTVTPATSVCSGASANLTAGGAATYVWTPSVTLNTSTGSNVTASPASTSTYSVAGTSANGCTATSTVTVTVKSNPVVTITSAVNVCSGLPGTLTASGATTYTWAPLNFLSASTGAAVNTTPASNITYTVTGTTNGCTNTKTVAVSILASPSVTYTVVKPTCSSMSDGAIDVVVSGVDSSAYKWSDGSTALNLANMGSGSYTITVTATNGCSVVKEVPLQPEACAIPLNLSSSAVSASSANVSWKQMVCSYGYKVRVHPAGSNSWTYYNVSSSDSGVSFLTLMDATLYNWQVQSFCNSQHSDSSGYSAIQSFTTMGDCKIPATPTIKSITEKSAVVQWHAINTAQRYELRYQKKGDATWILSYVPADQLKYDLTGLTPDTVYTVQVKTGCDTIADISSDWSPAKTFKTPMEGSTWLSDGMEIENNEVIVYPNPASDLIRVDASLGSAGFITISVIDVTGREFKKTEYQSATGTLSEEINISEFTGGMYLLKIVKDEETIVTRRIIKQQ